MFKWMDKKIIAILCSKILLNWPYDKIVNYKCNFLSIIILTCILGAQKNHQIETNVLA